MRKNYRKPYLLLKLRKRLAACGFTHSWAGNTLWVNHPMYGSWRLVGSSCGQYVGLYRVGGLLDVMYEYYAPNVVVLERKIFFAFNDYVNVMKVNREKVVTPKQPLQRVRSFETVIENGQKKIKVVYKPLN